MRTAALGLACLPCQQEAWARPVAERSPLLLGLRLAFAAAGQLFASIFNAKVEADCRTAQVGG